MDFGVSCPLCESTSVIFNFKVGSSSLYSCKQCDLHFIDPYVQNEINRNPLSEEKQYATERLAVDFYLPYIKKFIFNQNSILDIGCGCGELLNECKKLNVKTIVGLENDSQRAKFAEKHTGCLIINEDFLTFKSDKQYNVITLINVISHIPDLNTFFSKVKSLLADNGRLVIKTGLMFNGFKKNNGYDWQIPEHIHFLGNNTPEYIADKYNFKLVQKIMIPLAKDLISKEYLLSPGRSSVMNFCKKFLLKIPFGIQLVQNVYSRYTRNKLYTTILVLER